MIETTRLILRGWERRDRAPFAALGRDGRVMATLGPRMSRADSDALIERLEAIRAAHGFTFWAIERRRDGRFLGFCGLKPGPAGTRIEDQVEIGWRLGHGYWGQGYAREAAAASIAWAWANTREPALWGITTPGNLRSWGLMERLGMTREPDGDFDHPRLAAGDPLRQHITYRIARPALAAQGEGSRAAMAAARADCCATAASARSRAASSGA